MVLSLCLAHSSRVLQPLVCMISLEKIHFFSHNALIKLNLNLLASTSRCLRCATHHTGYMSNVLFLLFEVQYGVSAIAL